jgi:hypothetical protein
VAEEFRNMLGGRILVSDAPEFEERWLRKLYSSAGLEVPAIKDYDFVSSAMFNTSEFYIVYREMDREPAPHRAGPDSARLVRAWLTAVRPLDG